MKKLKKPSPKTKTFSARIQSTGINKKLLMLFIIVFAGIGAALIIVSHAATPVASIEPETKSIVSPAISGSDSNASGGSYVQFKAASTTVPGNRAKATLGVFPGYGDASGTSRMLSFESYLGRQLSVADSNLGYVSWTDFGGSAWGQFTAANNSMFYTLQRVRPAITVGMGVRANYISPPTSFADQAARLREIASGADDGNYTNAANYMVSSGHGDAIIRLAHEADIDGYPWSFNGGNQDLYKQAFQHIHDVMKSVSPNFKFDYQGDGNWNLPNPYAGNTKYGDSAYPGDSYVDFIGVDVYDVNAGWTDSKAELDYTLDFAKRHGKQMSIPEWGLWKTGNNNGHGDDPTYIQNMYNWINAAPASGPGSIAYHSYFNWDGEGDSNLDQFPNSKALFKQLFGN